MSSVPPLRIRRANDQEVHASGVYVLYWMVASRRTTWNFSLQRAVEWARDLRKPLLVLEPLRCGYRWASDRLHAFVIQGMVDTARALRQTNVPYYPYLEPEPGAGKELLPALAKNACVVISDDYPCFFLPRMFSAAAERLQVRFELVDSNGLLPMRAADRVFGRAVDFRRFLQKNLRPHLADLPEPDPLEGVRLPKLGTLPTAATRRWPPAEPLSVGRVSGQPGPVSDRSHRRRLSDTRRFIRGPRNAPVIPGNTAPAVRVIPQRAGAACDQRPRPVPSFWTPRAAPGVCGSHGP